MLGISADSPQKQKAFKQKYDLPFSLLADPERQVCQSYGVLKEKTLYGVKRLAIDRTTFLVGPEGKIAKVWTAVKAQGHAEEVLKAIK